VRAFQLQQGGKAYSVGFSPDGTQVLAGVAYAEPPEAILWDAENGQQVRTFLHEPWPEIGRFSPDGHWVLTRSMQSDCRIWDTADGQHLYTVVVPAGSLFYLSGEAFSPDGSILFTLSNGAVAMWELIANPELAITHHVDGSILLTWENPSGSRAYVLQQCPDLSAGNWERISVSTPGQHEVTNPSGTMFFRLMEP